MYAQNEHFKFDALYKSQNSWDGAMFTKCCISFSFQNSLKTSGLRVSVVLVLEFGPILAWYRFPAAAEFVVVFDVFFI